MTTVSNDGPIVSPVRGFAVTGLIMVTAVLAVGQLYAYLPFLPAMAQRLSTTPAGAGLMTTVFALAQAAGFLAVGWLNRVFTGRVLLAGGIAGLAVASLVAGYALQLGHETGFLVARGLQGLATAAFPPFALAAVIELNGPRYRPAAIGLFSASLLLSAPLSQLLASAIADAWAPRGAFFASAVALLPVAGILCRVRFGKTRTPTAKAGFGPVLALLRWKALGRLYAATFVLLMGVVFYYAAIAASDTQSDLQLFRLLGAPAVLMTLLSGAMLYRWPAPNVQAAGFAAAAAGALLTGIAGGGAGLQLGHWLMMGGIATAVPAVLSYLGEQPSGVRQRAILLYTIILFAGASLAAPAAGVDRSLVEKMALLAAVYGTAALVVVSYRRWPAAVDGEGA